MHPNSYGVNRVTPPITAGLTAIREDFPVHSLWWGRGEEGKNLLFEGGPFELKFIAIAQTWTCLISYTYDYPSGK